MRDPQTDRYQFRAEVRHEAGRGSAGLYLGYRRYETPGGPAFVWVQLYFNDIDSEKKQGEDLLQSVPDLRNDPNMVKHAPKANRLNLQAILDCPEPGQAGWTVVAQEQDDVFEPHGLSHAQFRTVVVKVTPERIRVYWEDEPEPKLQVPAGFIKDGAARTVAVNGIWQRFPFLKDVPMTFTPRGGLGLLVDDSAVSFQNVRVEPLGSSD